MEKSYCKIVGFTALSGLAVVGSVLMVPQLSMANDELRVAAVIQIPFGGGESFFEVSNIRLGGTLQYAEVEEDEVTIDRQVRNDYLDGRLKSSSITGETVMTDEGDEVYGVEVNIFIQPFGGWIPSVEVLGFYGNNDVQGAFGGGYDWTDQWFLDAKAMLPYSEIGVRFIAPFEVYVGGKTFGSFDPDSNTTVNDHITNVYKVTPATDAPATDALATDALATDALATDNPCRDGSVLMPDGSCGSGPGF